MSIRTFRKIRLLALSFALLALLNISCTTLKEEEAPLPEISADEPGPYEVQVGEEPPPTVIGYENYSDPLEFINRPFFYFNDVIYRYGLSPLAQGYDFIVPTLMDESIGQFFSNLREPLYAVNFLLQGKPTRSGISILRLVVNSTLGILGFFDPAETYMRLKDERTTLNETLASWGMGYGAYFMIPLLGPSNLRDGLTRTFEYFTHPLTFVDDRLLTTSLFALEGFQNQVPLLTRYPDIVEDLDDPYIFTRNLYLQQLLRDEQADRGKEFEKAGGRQQAK